MMHDNLEQQDLEQQIVTLDKLMLDIESQRHQLLLRWHLLKSEAKNEWVKIEKSRRQFRAQSNHICHKAKEIPKDMEIAMRAFGEEIKNSYQRIYSSIS